MIYSQDTLNRIEAASIEALLTDQDLVVQSDYILSVVPPRDSLATARRIFEALQLPDTLSKRAQLRQSGSQKVHFFDLNATAPRLMREIDDLFASLSEPGQKEATVQFLDGGIIGGPPSYNEGNQTWKRPSIVLSGQIGRAHV